MFAIEGVSKTIGKWWIEGKMANSGKENGGCEGNDGGFRETGRIRGTRDESPSIIKSGWFHTVHSKELERMQIDRERAKIHFSHLHATMSMSQTASLVNGSWSYSHELES